MGTDKKELSAMSTTAAIRQYIKDHPDQIIDVAFLHKNFFPIVGKYTFLKTMTRIRDESLIKSVSHGVYAPATIPEEKVPEAVLEYYAGHTHGMPHGDALYHELGLIDQPPKEIKIYTNRLGNDKKRRVLNLELIGANVIFDEAAKDLVTLLELIEDRDYAIALNSVKYAEIIEKLQKKDYSLALLKEIRESINYRSNTFTALKKLLG